MIDDKQTNKKPPICFFVIEPKYFLGIVIREAEKKGTIVPYASPRCRVFEGTSGSTGISLALVARALGYEAEIVLPDDTAVEKSQLIENMGATIVKVRPVSISNRSHYVNVARDRAQRFIEDGGKGLFVDQFENQMNWLTHYETTGPEIWQQSRGKVDYFVAGAGTGGTIAGVGKFLKSVASDVQLILADPPGSGLFNKVKHGVMFSKTEIEGKRRRHQIDTVRPQKKNSTLMKHSFHDPESSGMIDHPPFSLIPLDANRWSRGSGRID
ncbi:hypothetical protein PGT21_017883 [Puccinia graminis f. sp. tritici]|uniref:Tryptophan synthase beta chain-like PALP domain-containing protein n=1 Tax=Puccinia graminis f. sp. tritici TaxID=56615 RepID=A0A5B0NJF4_PUCGR|nr:hypothetical protein PGT21_017883 [Puccinia graminis f. sp. tritici]